MLRPTLLQRAIVAGGRCLVTAPGLIRRLVAGPLRRNDRDQPLDPGTQVLLRLQAVVQGPPTYDVEVRRKKTRESSAMAQGPAPPCETNDVQLPGPAGPIPARVYRPAEAQHWPVLVYLHGGGWVTGDLDTHDVLARRLAVEGRRVVVAVDYRRSPEHPFPAALEDTVAAFRAVRERASEWGGDPDRVGIGGDSAGGNLSASACGLLTDNKPDVQLLIYPSVDLRCRTTSYRTLGEGYMLTRESIDWFIVQYAAPLDDPRASPLLRPSLRRDPPAIVAIAGFDPLRDEGENYVNALQAADVPVTVLCFDGLVHAFANMDGLVPAADRAVADIARALRAHGDR